MAQKSQNALLTGASRGIGKAIADGLQARDIPYLGQSTKGGDSLLASDFSQSNSAKLLWQEALDRSEGNIDILINNAGLFKASPLDQSHDEWCADWQETMMINLTASAELCRLAVRHWQERECSGRIVNIASRAANRGDSPQHWHYAASKGGMVAMTKTIARAYAAQDIYAFAICPGFTMTGMADDYLESRGGDKLLADIPLGRVAQPEEIASIALYCALDAPPSMTGAVLDANGASYVR
jgi:NAD(P)-dependent dehydrogenase (short-subunit alcohol dehydrogenase family)